MQKQFQIHHKSYQSLAFISIIFLVFITILLFTGQIRESHAARLTVTELYLPTVYTNSREAAIPSYQTGFPLTGALCSNDIAINNHSGDVYITNEESDNLSVIRNSQLADTLPTGNWPIFVESDPFSSKVYVSQVLSGISIIDNGQITANIPPYHESYFIVVNTKNGYTYVSDLHRPLTILRGSEKITDLFVPKFDNHTIEWQLTGVFDELTGLTYFASWQKGIMTVIENTSVVDQFRYYGEGAKDMVIDPYRRLLYVANFRAGEDGAWLNNVSIVNLDTKLVTPVYTAKHSRHIAIDPITGFVYATNPLDDTVTVLKGTEVVGTYRAGKKPWGVAVDTQTGYAYVTNAKGQSISVFKDGFPITTLDLPAEQGFQPWQIAIDEPNRQIYVLNRSSVLKSGNSTNGIQIIDCKQPWVHIFGY